tara:strand:- start:192 stop:389 length:198 start_codon:yes stop_codon:yes gene_type:complete
MQNDNDNNNDKILNIYIDILTDIEKKGLKIAEQQLGTSFDIKKSIGYLEFLKNRKSNDDENVHQS